MDGSSEVKRPEDGLALIYPFDGQEVGQFVGHLIVLAQPVLHEDLESGSIEGGEFEATDCAPVGVDVDWREDDEGQPNHPAGGAKNAGEVNFFARTQRGWAMMTPQSHGVQFDSSPLIKSVIWGN